MSASDWAFAFAGSSMLLVSKADGLRVPTRGEVAGLIGEPAWGVAEAAAGSPRVEGRPGGALAIWSNQSGTSADRTHRYQSRGLS